MSGPTLDALIASVGEMGTLPDSWHRIDEVVSRPSATTAQISDAISTDPALSARLLRLANSPLLGMTQRIDRLSQAVHLIGTRQIRELALATSVVDTLSKIPGSRERMQVYLLRSVSAGLVARGLAGRRREANVERFFVIGLLHHIGVLVLDMYAPESAQVVRTTVQATNEPSEQVELDVLGYDHAAVGAALLTRWKLPTSLIEPIAFHHKPYQAPTQRVESAAAHVASIVTELLAPGSLVTTPFDPRAWELLAVDAQALTPITNAAEEQAKTMLGALIGTAE